MPIPKTFSAASDGYAPTPVDSVRYGVWLLLYSDDVNRRAYSYVPDDPSRGVRIYQGRADVDPQDQRRLTVPQQVISAGIGNVTWQYLMTHGGTMRIPIIILLLEKPDTSYLDTNVDASQVTPEQKLVRVMEILMRGTLFAEDQDPHTSMLIDPYYTPRLPDGTYDTDQLRILANTAPELRPLVPVSIDARIGMTEAERRNIDLVNDIAVAYGWTATYEVEIRDREDMLHGGSLNG